MARQRKRTTRPPSCAHCRELEEENQRLRERNQKLEKEVVPCLLRDIVKLRDKLSQANEKKCAEVRRLRDEGKQRKEIASILMMSLEMVDYYLYDKGRPKPPPPPPRT